MQPPPICSHSPASNWSMVITWPGYWPLIGPSASHSPASGDQLQMLPRPRPPAGEIVGDSLHDAKKYISKKREKYCRVERKKWSRHNPGSGGCQSGTLITRETHLMSLMSRHASHRASWHRDVTCQVWRVSPGAQVILCCVASSGAECHCAEEKSNTCFTQTLVPQPLPPDIYPVFLGAEYIPGMCKCRRLFWFPALLGAGAVQSV